MPRLYGGANSLTEELLIDELLPPDVTGSEAEPESMAGKVGPLDTLNGVQAMSDGGMLDVMVRRVEGAVTIEVRDQGSGIPPEIRDKIFNLYFTTKRAGSGIGLAMSYRVMQLHNGALDFVTEMGRGTTFRLVLPLTGTQDRENLEASLALERRGAL